jgi:hypothetical protein
LRALDYVGEATEQLLAVLLIEQPVKVLEQRFDGTLRRFKSRWLIRVELELPTVIPDQRLPARDPV